MSQKLVVCKDVLAVCGSTGFSWFLSIVQSNQTFQLISVICSIVLTILNIVFVIYRWYKKAMEDNKLTEEEVEELFDELFQKKDERSK